MSPSWRPIESFQVTMKFSFFEIVSTVLRARALKIRDDLHAYCLGLDIVGYSKHTTDVQCLMVKRIQQIVYYSKALQDVLRRHMVFLPTGDGMIICVLEEERPALLVQLAEEIQAGLIAHNRGKAEEDQIVVRMGLHSGTGASYVDINGNLNIAGTVANITQRVMAFGQDWHIIASKAAFDDIATLDRGYRRLFHPLGVGEAKHKVPIEVFNVYREDPPFGNPESPAHFESKTSPSIPIDPPPTDSASIPASEADF